MPLKRDKNDLVFSQLIRERANWCCERCGRDFSERRESLHCSHLNGRRHASTRWHPFNAFAHCLGCHRVLGSEPYQFTAFAIIEFGLKTVELVGARAMKPVRLKQWEKDRLHVHLKGELVRLRQLRKDGEQGLIEFTAPDWYQDGITRHMGLTC
ncbi:hypothetical protein KCT17_003671 [Escherichia coli]|nr:hypothetical protein [Escherichia coli]